MGYEDFQKERSDRPSSSRFGGRGGGRSFGGRDDRRSGGRSFGGSRGGFGGGRDRREMPMCDAVCAKCGKNCKVPFKPTGSKPVFCSECFRSNNEGFSDSRERSSPQQNGSSDELKQINKKLDKILKILEEIEVEEEYEDEEETEA